MARRSKNIDGDTTGNYFNCRAGTRHNNKKWTRTPRVVGLHRDWRLVVGRGRELSVCATWYLMKINQNHWIALRTSLIVPKSGKNDFPLVLWTGFGLRVMDFWKFRNSAAKFSPAASTASLSAPLPNYRQTNQVFHSILLFDNIDSYTLMQICPPSIFFGGTRQTIASHHHRSLLRDGMWFFRCCRYTVQNNKRPSLWAYQYK